MKIENQTHLRVLSGSCFTLAVIASCFVLYFAKDVFVPLVLATFLFYSISPLPYFLSRKLKVNRAASIIITFLVITGAISLLVLGSVLSINSFLSDLSLYQDKLHLFIEEFIVILNENGVQLDRAQVKQNILQLPIFNISKSMASFASGFVGNSLLVLLLLVFIFLSSGSKKHSNLSFDRIGKSISLYTDTKIAVSLVTALLSWIVMAIIGLDLALMIAILTFILNFIPSIGSVIAILLPLPIALLQFGPSPSLVALITLLSTIQFSIGNVLEPKLMGSGLGIHPITVLASLILWGLIWGLPGMFLSVPLTVAIKIVCEEFNYTKKIAKIIEGNF